MNNYINDLSANFKNIYNYDSFLIYKIINSAIENQEIQKIIINNQHILMNKLSLDFNFFDILSLYSLGKIREFKEIRNNLIEKTLFPIFSKQTLLFIKNINNTIQKDNIQNKNQIYNLIFAILQSESSEKASKILYNLYLLPDFKIELEKRYFFLTTLLEKYQVFDVDSIIKNAFKGSSILGLLLKDNNEQLIVRFIQDLLDKYNLELKDITCIGGGSTCLVYKIGNSVLKLGEIRNQRKIYVNHRILASQVKLLLKNNNTDLFYIEVMKYIKTGDITKDECDELTESLLKQGLIWEDAKPENCGLLDDNDDNISFLPVDYEEVAGIIDNPCEKELFMKRKRKVVVLDNDDIRLNPKALWK